MMDSYRKNFVCNSCFSSTKEVELKNSSLQKEVQSLQKIITATKLVYNNSIKIIINPYLTILASSILLILAGYQIEHKHDYVAMSLYIISAMLIIYRALSSTPKIN